MRLLYVYEIVQGMMTEEYTDGCIFQNPDMGDIYILNDELTWMDDKTPFVIVVGDESRWELVSRND